MYSQRRWTGVAETAADIAANEKSMRMERNRLNEASGRIFEIRAAKSLRLNVSYGNVEPCGSNIRLGERPLKRGILQSRSKIFVTCARNRFNLQFLRGSHEVVDE